MMLRILLIFLGCLSTVAWANDITVEADRTTLNVNETLQLTYRLTPPVSGSPDFAELSDDFEIVGRTQSTLFNMVNNRSTRQVLWTLSVRPRKTGELTVPSIRFGQQQSPSLKITVNATGTQNNTAQRTDDLFMNAEVSTTTPYVQQQVILTLKIHIGSRFNNAQIEDPELDSTNVVFRRFGNDRKYQQFLNGQRYTVFERQYLLFPQQSGDLSIAPITLTAEEVNRGRLLFDPWGMRGKQVRTQSDTINLTVRPIPTQFTGQHWLPAQSVSISEDWPVSGPLETGEPVTRSITIRASGLTSAQLPELDPVSVNTIRTYNEQPELNDTEAVTGIGVIGTRKEQQVILPTQAGSYTLPPIELAWWDVDTDTLQKARLPARTLLVSGVGTTSTVPQTVPSKTDPVEPAVTITNVPAPVTQRVAPFWKTLAIILMVLLLLSAYLLYRLWRKPLKTSTSPPRHIVNNSSLAKAFQSACRDNDLQRARDTLMVWIQSLSGQTITQLTDVERWLDEPRLKPWFADFSRQLYSQYAPTGSVNTTWKGLAFYNAIQKGVKQRTQSSSASSLKPLYPIQT